MLSEILDKVTHERASLARDLEYCKEAVNDEIIDDLTEKVERAYDIESTDELVEAAEWVERLDTVINDDSFAAEEAAEVERIISAEGDITFDEMIGLGEE